MVCEPAHGSRTDTQKTPRFLRGVVQEVDEDDRRTLANGQRCEGPIHPVAAFDVFERIALRRPAEHAFLIIVRRYRVLNALIAVR